MEYSLFGLFGLFVINLALIQLHAYDLETHCFGYIYICQLD